MYRPFWIAVAACCLAIPASASDYFLTIGGGYSPAGNQVSLEKNVHYFQRCLAQRYPEGAEHAIYFADGDAEGRDLQYVDSQQSTPRVLELLATVFQQTRHQEDRYRNHEIPQLRGASTRQNLQQWFQEDGQRLQPGDRLFVYASAHGGKSPDRRQPGNTRLMLWNRESLLVSELTHYLDALPEGVSTTLVMVQCYSGGFANFLFHDGDPAKGLAPQPRCGFFATVEDRVAAGCTSDIREENYLEYSTYFWAALFGETRTGQSVPPPDYDGDGVVSLAEAHAFTLLTSTTIDISVKTSDAMLRTFSKLGGDSKRSGQSAAADLLSSDSPFEELFALGAPADQAVLRGLSEELHLTDARRGSEAGRLAAQCEREKKNADDGIRRKQGELNGVCAALQSALLQHWPELENRWHPDVQQLLGRDAPQVIRQIESHRMYARFVSLQQEITGLRTERMQAERRFAKCQRLIRQLENVALAANLPYVAGSEIQARYQELLTLENSTLSPVALP
ncbi:hypothetical protein [Lignipirellula cremea]|uniref:Caspase domain protein n=1 Tax=Lignipirellula cremea TaxID=2528010 RepID=A0A518DY66_9BACT|nr:hypothetical protein [Lignipirellula cremea]QDU96792.1 hypothetical protein Pla8534_46130 [Lignipirellula cremea]